MSSEYQKGPEEGTQVQAGPGEDTGTKLNYMRCKW